MSEYRQKLAQLARDSAKIKHMESVHKDLLNQRTELREKCDELNVVRIQESEDVTALENGNITTFFLNLTGRLDERLDKERREAYAAQAKYDTARRELSQLEYEIDKYSAELEALYNSDRQYRRMIQERIENIKTGSADSDDSFALEQNLIILQQQQHELEEAIAAGNAAAATTGEIMNYLNKADKRSTADFLLDSFLADLVKHDNLEKAQNSIELLQNQLRKFRSELADVTIDKNISVKIDSFTSFADFFFDGIFSNLAVQEKITNAKNQVSNTKYQIYNTINALNAMLNENYRQQQTTKEKINSI